MILHNAIQENQKSILMSVATTKVYLYRPKRLPKVVLKVVKVHNGDQALETRPPIPHHISITMERTC